MSLPNQLRSARLSDASIGNTIDNALGDAEKALCDILGIPVDTDVTAVLFEIVAGGLKSIIIQDAAADPGAGGVIRRNGAALKFHDGNAVRELRRSFEKTTAGATIVNTVAETGIYALSIPANTLGIDGALKLTMLCKATLAAVPGTTLTVRLKYGATTLATQAIGWIQGTTSYFTIDVWLVGDGATNAQTGFIKLSGDQNEISGNNLMRMMAGTATEDSTAAKTLTITGQWDTNDDTFALLYAVLEKI